MILIYTNQERFSQFQRFRETRVPLCHAAQTKDDRRITSGGHPLSASAERLIPDSKECAKVSESSHMWKEIDKTEIGNTDRGQKSKIVVRGHYLNLFEMAAL